MNLFPPEPPREPVPPQAPAPIRPRHRWRRFFAWAAGTILLLLIAFGVTIAVLLHSQRFHDYVLAKAQSSASDSLNARVDLQNFSLSFAPLGLDVYGVTIHGAAPYTSTPVLQLQHAHVGIRIVSFLQRKWYLSDVQLDHPTVQVFVDKNGASNIPKPKPSNSNSNTTIWDLGIRHTVLDHGEIYYNAQSTPLTADLHDLDFRAAFSELLKMYSGELKYTNGRVVFGAYEPLTHNLDAQFDLTPTTLQLHRAQIDSNAAQINLVATAGNFSAPNVQAKYDIKVDGSQLARMIHNKSVPQGTLQATGTATWQQVPNQPAINAVTINGDLNSKRLVVTTPSLRAAVDDIAAHYSLANGDVVLHDLRAGVLGGQITAQGTMKQVAGASPHSEMTASLRRISLAQASNLMPSKSKQPVGVTGELNADAKASWGKTFDDLVAKVDSTINAQVAGKGVPPAPPGATLATAPAATLPSEVSINSQIHATYTGANKSVAVADSYLRTPQTTVNLNGTLSNRSSLAVHVQANDLREVAAIAGMFRTSAPGQPPPLDLAGAANFSGNVTGSTSAPHLTGQLAATNLHVNGSDWKVFRTGVDASPSEARLINADLEPEPRGRIKLNASVGLHQWSFEKTNPIQVDMDASQLDVASLAKLAGQQIPVTGTLNTRVAVHGTAANPIGSGDLSLTKATAYNEPIDSVQIKFGGTADQAKADLTVKLPAGSIQGNVTVRPNDKTYTAHLTSTGIDIQKLETVKSKNIDAAGTVAINATGQGTFDNPQVTASIQIPSLTIKNQQVANIKLDAEIVNHVANATLSSAAMNTNIQAKARINLTGDYDADATVDTQNIPLQPIVALFSPANAASLTGATELHATVHGPAKDKNRLEAHVTIPYINVNYNNVIQLASAAPIHADYKNSVVTLQHSAIKGTDTNLEFEGSIPVGSNGPMSLVLKGNVDLALAQIFDPDVRTSGNIRFNIDSHGTSASDIGGEIDIVNAAYSSADLPVGLQNGNGVLKLTTDRVNIQSFRGTVGGGEVTASGGVAYRPNLQFALGLSARNIRMLYPEGMRESIDADIRLAGSTENAVLGGSVNLTNLSLTPAFDLSSFAGQFSGGVQVPPAAGSITQNIHLNLAVRSTNNINLVSRTLSIAGAANLQVRGTADQPVILGRVNLTGGDMILNGNRFLLTGGTIQFVNPTETQPVVNIAVSTTIQQYDISMKFRGPTDKMQTQYTSDPALPEADIIHLLAFGNTEEAAANAPATTATQQAQSLVANEVSSQITGRVAKIAGISQLSISPVLGNAQNNQQAGANITIQQRVTGHLYITFSTNTAEGTQTIQGQYKISPKVSLSATRDPNGGFAFDALIKKEY
ncbi:MAG TPA: translocation/assembly module TamB domain-containing protein [Terracidiphilus sp.]|jgi:translocation and assembly module TamB